MSRKRKLRSQAWFGGDVKRAYIHRAWMKNQGIPDDAFDGRPVIGICNTWSELTPCNAHLRGVAERVKRGVYEAGGLPLEFPAMSLGESSLRPTAMLFRNLASMDVEESIRGNPIDGVVLLVGCDKTTPALVMGAASCDLPSLVISGGPMLNGKHCGRDLGSGTYYWKLIDQLNAGQISERELIEAEGGSARSAGHCNTMGTASTMACMVESLGLGLPQNAAIPAVDARRNVLAQLAGRRIVGMVDEDLRMSKILTREAFENAIYAITAISGSTNAAIHLIAIARRIGVDLTLDDWDRLSRDIPALVNLQPAGRFLMEEFYYAGGLPPVLRLLGEAGRLHRDALTVNGHTIWDNVADAPIHDPEVIRDFSRPLNENGGLAILKGNLAPDGAVLKTAAASAHLLRHTGKAVVFEDIDDYRSRIADPDLAIDDTSVMVLKNCGPCGYPGMAEVGNMQLPPKLVRQGVEDMVRISDARMSGTAFGTVVLHVSPEAGVGGPLALVREGDEIELDVERRRLQLNVSDEELARRRDAWQPRPPAMNTGYQRLYVDHVLQAHEGADLDFLSGCRGAKVPRPPH